MTEEVNPNKYFYGYRLQPPTNYKKKIMKGEKEITKYFLAHIVVGEEEPIPILDFLKYLVDKCECPEKACLKLCSMFPSTYVMTAAFIFGSIANDYWDRQKKNKKST